jgi:hypothetical protein
MRTDKQTSTSRVTCVMWPFPNHSNVDEHATTLSAYFDISDHLWYSCDIWTQCTTQTLFQNVFWASRNLHNVIPIISDLVRSISTFSMFLCYFESLLAYIGLVSTSMDYLCIPYTIVYLSDVFPTFSDLFLSLFIFALIDVPMFWLFLIVDRFHWFRCYYTFGFRSLWTISNIPPTPFWPLRCYHYLYLTYHSHSKERITSPFIPETS